MIDKYLNKWIDEAKNAASLDGIHELSRPSWETYFMDICDKVATRSTCMRRHVGAVIVKDNRILATGYNGAPSGLVHCAEIGCYRKENNVPSGTMAEACRASHAEQNAIVQAARYGIPIDGSTLYCTNFPCSICTKLIINAGIVCVIYHDDYNDKLAKELLDEADIDVIQYD